MIAFLTGLTVGALAGWLLLPRPERATRFVEWSKGKLDAFFGAP